VIIMIIMFDRLCQNANTWSYSTLQVINFQSLRWQLNGLGYTFLTQPSWHAQLFSSWPKAARLSILRTGPGIAYSMNLRAHCKPMEKPFAASAGAGAGPELVVNG